ncbi:enoyl-CoA hydratase-related protein [Chachezhania sediminis]|uniref:enoyl-CoA hydratase-related protein n=1 Tax=Chachezhania sediminis TaxID=2599291 RepID=UPI00131C7FA2|nr:enoyl-CoA hydratase-related protein [Chachezhania sediminis]
MNDTVNIRQDGAVLTATITREERRNALNAQVAEGIIAAISRAEADPDIRALVLTGAGDRAFCAGGDLQPNAEGTPFKLDEAHPVNYVADLFRAMNDARVPIIARLNGHALAGGFGLVCGCDLVVAREDALIGVTEVKIGIFPMMILPFLMRNTPNRLLMEMCLTGEPITAAEGLPHGLVNYAVPVADLDAKTDWLVERIISKSPTGVRLGLQALSKIREMSFDAALEYAPFMLANMARTEDAREGFRAFVEKRAPEWTGR